MKRGGANHISPLVISAVSYLVPEILKIQYSHLATENLKYHISHLNSWQPSASSHMLQYLSTKKESPEGLPVVGDYFTMRSFPS